MSIVGMFVRRRRRRRLRIIHAVMMMMDERSMLVTMVMTLLLLLLLLLPLIHACLFHPSSSQRYADFPASTIGSAPFCPVFDTKLTSPMSFRYVIIDIHASENVAKSPYSSP